ncbi:hypothetical protein [Isoptericola variabilis]|uniref:Uncharacterized protein n=1 Tax=Isoptericola variabilis (strain 225) TaxID=743718 RepID=F6FQ08_ISOV2|nr:hypothetical protein [Isoptericola variabilis]AEG44814.1 hypothetical protein Isova_2085 [Isoptericola variabilis 225]TWH30700.1 hypothetical protein L600_002900000320 [Isoptericola variabilis J7]TWH31664.1 hypothetical protein L600_002200000560 [Isoptericola variabilis J7]
MRAAVHAVDDVRTAYLVRLLTEAGSADPGHRAAVVYRTLLGEYAMRHAGGSSIDAEAIDALTTWALDPE